MMKGKVGSNSIEWKTMPQGHQGESVVVLHDQEVRVRWRRDAQGIWIVTDQGFTGFDQRVSVGDDGLVQSYLLKRKSHREVSTLGFVKQGEGLTSSTASASKKGAKIKSQMPGKIIRVLAAVGASVKKGQPILVMEAMKMENEIKAPIDGVIKVIHTSLGAAVETGAVLIEFEIK